MCVCAELPAAASLGSLYLRPPGGPASIPPPEASSFGNVRGPPMGCPDLINVKFMPVVSLPHAVYCLISNDQTHSIPPSPTHGSHFPPSPASRAAAASDQLAHLESAARAGLGAQPERPEQAWGCRQQTLLRAACLGIRCGREESGTLWKLQCSSCILAIRPNLLRQEVQMSPNWFHSYASLHFPRKRRS